MKDMMTLLEKHSIGTSKDYCSK